MPCSEREKRNAETAIVSTRLNLSSEPANDEDDEDYEDDGEKNI